MKRTIGKKGLELIKSFEGCRLTAYQDVVGVWTIGYGHTGNVKPGMKISEKEAEKLLIKDCQRFADFVDSTYYVPFTSQLNENQRDALISFAYNVGQGNLKQLCAGKKISQIAKIMLLYNKAGGKVYPGLVRRREAEVKLFNTPCGKDIPSKK